MDELKNVPKIKLFRCSVLCWHASHQFLGPYGLAHLTQTLINFSVVQKFTFFEFCDFWRSGYNRRRLNAIKTETETERLLVKNPAKFFETEYFGAQEVDIFFFE